MKKALLVLALVVCPMILLYGQTDTTITVSEKIVIERDNALKSLKDSLIANENEIKRLQDQLSESRDTETRLKTIDSLQRKLDERIVKLETSEKAKTKYNAELAFIELLGVQKDLRPYDLFISSQKFFNELSNISNLQNYPSFTTWKTEYTKWYDKQDKNDQMMQLINKSIELIGNVTNEIPIYGSIAQTATAGISDIVLTLGSRHKELKDKTPEMLLLLSAASQFENQKAIINHEWKQIEKELDQLQLENDKLLDEQLIYYGIDKHDYQTYYQTSLRNQETLFEEGSRIKINKKLDYLNNDHETFDLWINQVEIYMHKVQSLRIRFGNLGNRMLSNISEYEKLIALYSDTNKFPLQLSTEITKLKDSLKDVREKINDNFKPEKYIAESEIMYLQSKPKSSE